MITDRIQLAGTDAYIEDPQNAGIVNLGTNVPAGVNRAYPIVVRTEPMEKGKQLELSGIQILLESDDLSALFRRQPAPIIEVGIMKELFSGLFADPYDHRVHNIAGYADFNEGNLTNGRVMEVDGLPTIVSTGRNECIWVSKEYVLPEPIVIDAVSWELATTRLSAPDSFKYKIRIDCFDDAGNNIGTVSNGANYRKADAKRMIELTAVQQVVNVRSFQITFQAIVNVDSSLNERGLPAMNDPVGRPLLRAVNILELLPDSIYSIYSLTELAGLSSNFKTYETPGPEVKRFLCTLDLKALFVHSENNVISAAGNYAAQTRYEWLEAKINTDQLKTCEMKMNGEILIRVNGK